jgi:sulfotransferase family protein
VKVIGAGFGRTGTLSTKAALEQLGFGPCYHMVEVFSHPKHLAVWEAAAFGRPVDWHEIFDHYPASVDWPACAFYEPLMQLYPDAKVLLTVRDSDKWYESVRETIYRLSQRGKGLRGAAMNALFSVASLIRPSLKRQIRMVRKLIWEDTFNNRFEDRAYAIGVYEQHNERVKTSVPAHRLLVFDVKQGWEPLCTFMGIEVPKDTPFPHLNDRASFGRLRRGGMPSST